MSQFEQHTPEDNDAERHIWRNSFEEAIDMPPPRVWDAIERRLDEEERGIVPLWGTVPASGAGAGSVAGGLAQGTAQLFRPWLRWSAAAAALVLISIGWWALQPNSIETASTSIADRAARPQQAPAAQEKAGNVAPESIAAAPIKGSTDNNGRLTSEAKNAEKPIRLGVVSNDQQLVSAGRMSNVYNRKPARTRPTIQPAESLIAIETTKEPSAANPVAIQSNGQAQSNTVLADKAISQPAMAAQTREGSQSTNPALPSLLSDESAALAFTNIALLAPQSIHTNLHETQRIVWFRSEQTEPTEVETSKPDSRRELWASASVMPNSYNPAVSLQSAPTGSTFANYVPTNRSAAGSELVNSQANLSVAYQLTTGMQVGKRWSVETGVGYLEAHSTVYSPTQTVLPSMASATVAVPKSSNLYTEALRGSTASLALASMDKTGQSYIANSNMYNAAQSQALRNDYQFVQVPVQIGYQLRPRKRLGMALLGGLLTNWFIRNRVANELTITTQDGVYRPITLSATTGLRFRYRPTQRWSASLAGVYQHALQNGTTSAIGVQTHPKTVGINMGVDYHF